MAQQSSAKEVDPEDVSKVIVFLKEVGASSSIPDDCCTNDSYSNILGRHIKVHKIQRGRLICHLSVKPAILNFFGGIHGGAIAAFSERMAIACARTVVAEDKEIFLGELGISYLSAAPHNAELIMEASVVRSGRNVTVVAVEFKFTDTGKLHFSGEELKRLELDSTTATDDHPTPLQISPLQHIDCEKLRVGQLRRKRRSSGTPLQFQRAFSINRQNEALLSKKIPGPNPVK